MADNNSDDYEVKKSEFGDEKEVKVKAPSIDEAKELFDYAWGDKHE